MTNSTTKVYDEALQERVRKYMKDTGLSQNKLAPRIGMSGASLSNYMNCKMDGSVEGIESRLREFLQQESEAAAVQVQVAPYKLDETYKPTSISEDVYQSIRYAQINRTLVMLHGDAGAGKTKAAVKYYRDNPQSTIYIRLDPSMSGLAGVGELLGAALDIPAVSSSKQMWQAIRARLRGTNKVIIVDEAQLLNIFPKISMMLGALVIVCLLCGSALAAVRWTFYKWERLIRMHDGIMILFEYRDHRDEFLAWREEQKK